MLFQVSKLVFDQWFPANALLTPYHLPGVFGYLFMTVMASHVSICILGTASPSVVSWCIPLAEVRFWDVYEDVHFLYVVPGLWRICPRIVPAFVCIRLRMRAKDGTVTMKLKLLFGSQCFGRCVQIGVTWSNECFTNKIKQVTNWQSVEDVCFPQSFSRHLRFWGHGPLPWRGSLLESWDFGGGTIEHGCFETKNGTIFWSISSIWESSSPRSNFCLGEKSSQPLPTSLGWQPAGTCNRNAPK